MAIDATAETFDKDVQGSMTVVDFWAPWCGPCKMMEPAMQNLERHPACPYADVYFMSTICWYSSS